MSGKIYEYETATEKLRRIYREEGPYSLARRAARYASRSVRPLGRLLRWRASHGVGLRPGWRPANSHEHRVFEDLFRSLHPDDVFYDIGAHTGLYTVVMASYLQPGNVVAFEPHAEYAADLERYLNEHDVAVRVERVAIAESDGDAAYTPGDRALTRDDGEAADQVTVRQVDGDSFLEAEGLPVPNVLKIDVAGAELDVVRGLRDTLRHPDCRLLYCEVHLPGCKEGPSISYHGGSVEELHRLLGELGFDLEVIGSERYLVYYLRCVKQEP